MDATANQQQLLSNASIDEIITEETALIDQQPRGDQAQEFATADSIIWNTSLLSEVCREGDIDRMRYFVEFSQQTLSCAKNAAEIADRLDIETGLSPLHHAARYQQLDICLMLLSNIQFELGVNIKDENGRTPIHSAFRLSNNLNKSRYEPEKPFDIDTDFGSKIQDIEVWQEEYRTKILISDHPLIYLFAKANGDLNAQDKYDLTPLHYAVARNNLGGAKQLISFHANIESRDRQGMRPLHYACKEGYLSIVEYLIEKGAKIDATDADHWIPLHYACAKGHLEIMKFIRSKNEMSFEKLIQMKTNTQASGLHLAVQHGDISSVEYILNEVREEVVKILINEQAEPLGTPLHVAAKFGEPLLIDCLYHHGADPLILNSQNQSALHIACVFNRLVIVKELLSLTQKSLLEIKDKRGQTALSVTTNTEIIDALITSGADIASRDNRHMNVLMLAVSKNQLPIVEHLLFAVDDKSPQIFNQVTKRKNRSLFALAAHTGSIPLCSALLKHHSVRWDAVDKNRWNIFHIAAQDDHYELMEYFCNHIRQSVALFSTRSISYVSPDTDRLNIVQASPTLRLYIDAQNEDGKTPLHVAAEQGHRLCIEVLLKYSADVLLPNFLGQLALHTAIQHGHSRCVEILLESLKRNMADFQSVLSRRQSPLLSACQNGFIDIVRLLLSQGIGIDDTSNENDENPLEIAIKYRQTHVINELLEHSHLDDWLMSIRNINGHTRQTPLREMIRYTPDCAKHAFDKFVVKSKEIDQHGNTFERTIYNYKYIDDYFTEKNQVYDKNGRHLYRNHPFIVALDTNQRFLLKHPLAQQLLQRKWRLYRPVFYFNSILRLSLLLFLSSYGLITPAPSAESSKPTSISHSIIRWMIIVLAAINLLRLIFEIISYRGLRIPFAQTIALISFLISIIAFLPFKTNNQMTQWQWQLAACSTLFQWINLAIRSSPVPFIGNCIILFQSILFNFLSLLFVTLPLLIAFTIATHMIFYNQNSFVTITLSMHKLLAMIIGEFEFETLFYAKPTLQLAAYVFISFMTIMSIVFMNLLLGLTVGDIKGCMENARSKAQSYRTREVIYIESTLPNISWLRSNIIDHEIVDIYPKKSVSSTTNKEEIEDDESSSSSNSQRSSEPTKLLDILNMLCTQAKHVLDKEVQLEKLLRQLLSTRRQT